MADIIDLNDRLRNHSDLLLNSADEYSKLAREAVDARNAYDLAKAQQTLKVSAASKSTVDIRNAEVLLTVQNEMRNARIAEAMLDAMAKRLRAVEASLSAVQSQARMLKVDAF